MRAFLRLSCRGASAVPSKVCIFAFILSRCVRRAKQSVYFRVYLVAVRSLWQAKCAFSCLSCRGAFAAPSKACIFAFILSRCVRRGKQSVHFRVYLVAVRPPRPAKHVFSRLSCGGTGAAESKTWILALSSMSAGVRVQQVAVFSVPLIGHVPRGQGSIVLSC